MPPDKGTDISRSFVYSSPISTRRDSKQLRKTSAGITNNIVKIEPPTGLPPQAVFELLSQWTYKERENIKWIRGGLEQSV